MNTTSWKLSADYTKHVVPNLAVLREFKVPESSIGLLFANPASVLKKHEQFKEMVNTVKEMGFEPSKSTFVLALHAISGKGNNSIWDRCYESYGKQGWSKDEILSAFKKQPQCMVLSEKKIARVMDFLVTKMGRHSKAIANQKCYKHNNSHTTIHTTADVSMTSAQNDVVLLFKKKKGREHNNALSFPFPFPFPFSFPFRSQFDDQRRRSIPSSPPPPATTTTQPSTPLPPLTAITTRLLGTSITTKLQAVLKSDCGRFSFANDCKTKEVLGAGRAVVMIRGHQGRRSAVKFQSLFQLLSFRVVSGLKQSDALPI